MLGRPSDGRASTFDCCGVRIDAVSVQEAGAALLSAATAGQKLAAHLCNAYTLSLALRDPRFRELLNDSDLNLPDGTPVAWLGSLVLRRVHARRPVPGPSLMTWVLANDDGRSVRHFLLGASERVLDDLVAALHRRYPAARVVGSLAPPFTPDIDHLMDASLDPVVSSGANLVWVGLGTPKQDWVADRLASSAGVVVVPVGAAFDFLSGAKPEAPQWLRGSGLEWAFRLLTEPRRLWRRYLLDSPLFLLGAVRSVWRHVRRRAREARSPDRSR